MSNVVFILGAGASQAAGVPLMANFLETAKNLLRKGEVGGAQAEFELVFRGVEAIGSVHSKSRLGTRNIEDVFAAFDMASIVGRFPGFSDDDIAKLPTAMRMVIAKTIEGSVLFEPQGHGFALHPPYPSFTDLLVRMPESRPSYDVSIVTFNYDHTLDFALRRQGIPFHYGLGQNGNGMALLKLHGSINWAYCRTCKKVVASELPELFGVYDWDLIRKSGGVHLPLTAGSKHPDCSQNDLEPLPYIVPPTWSKQDGHRALSSVWNRAARELAEAENIIVIGYSCPPSDAFFQYLYALGTVGQRSLDRFWVFDPKPKGSEVDLRFKKMLGPGAEDVHEHHPMNFANALEVLKKVFAPG